MGAQRSTYSSVAVILHWLIAALVVANIIIALYFLTLPPQARGGALSVHKSIGISVFLLALVRLGWRLTHPPLPAAMPRWERTFARATHVAFYVAIIVIPLLGWLTASSFPRSHTLYLGFIPWPNLPVPQSRAAAEGWGEAHGLLVLATVLLLALHIAGAIRNTYFRPYGVLGRMLPGVPEPAPRGYPGVANRG